MQLDGEGAGEWFGELGLQPEVRANCSRPVIPKSFQLLREIPGSLVFPKRAAKFGNLRTGVPKLVSNRTEGGSPGRVGLPANFQRPGVPN